MAISGLMPARPFRMADKVLLIMARRGDRWIAGALNLIGADCIF